MNRVADDSANPITHSSTVSTDTHLMVGVGEQSYQVVRYKMEKARAIVSISVLIGLVPSVLSVFFALLLGVEGASFRIEEWGGIIMVLICGLALIPSGYSLFKRKVLPIFATVTVLATACWSLISGALLLAEVHQSSYLTLAYSGVIIISGIILLENKGPLLPIGVALLQAYLVLLKLDSKINGGWQQVLLPLLIATLIICVLLTMLSVYLLVRRCFLEDVCSLRNFLLWLASMSLVSIVVFSLLPLIRSFATSNTVISVICSTFVFIFLGSFMLYLAIVREQVALAICDYDGALQPLKKGQHALACPQIPENECLYQHSKNYFKSEPAVTTESADDTTDDELHSECLVCMSRESSVVWMPCGHLTCCQTCAEYLLTHDKFECILCKQQPVFLAQIDTSCNSGPTNIKKHQVVRKYRLQ